MTSTEQNTSVFKFHQNSEQVGALEIKDGKLVFTGGADASAKVLIESLIDRLQPIINQEVRKALDSIEAPTDIGDDTEYAEGYDEAIDEYTANIKEVRKQYE